MSEKKPREFWASENEFGRIIFNSLEDLKKSMAHHDGNKIIHYREVLPMSEQIKKDLETLEDLIDAAYNPHSELHLDLRLVLGRIRKAFV